MPKLLILADDFTGALDTGVQLADYGAVTRVTTERNSDFRLLPDDVDVLVIDTETRHLTAEDAYSVIYKITEAAVKEKISYIYKKTDSALRGNIGAELTAVLNVSGRTKLAFIPAFPDMNRITKLGIQCVDGLPVNESVFGIDPFEPVQSADVEEIIHKQSAVLTKNVTKDVSTGTLHEKTDKPEILIFDAETNEDMFAIARRLRDEDQLHCLAGCAGFASVIPEILNIVGKHRSKPMLPNRLLVICGSVNPITIRQVDYAEQNEFDRIRLKTEEKLGDSFWDTDKGRDEIDSFAEILEKKHKLILDSNDPPDENQTYQYCRKCGMTLDEMRVRIAQNYGRILKGLSNAGISFTALITGGDTLMGCMRELGISDVNPCCDMGSGAVLSSFMLNGMQQYVISKSGGFGPDKLIVNLADQILETH